MQDDEIKTITDMIGDNLSVASACTGETYATVPEGLLDRVHAELYELSETVSPDNLVQGIGEVAKQWESIEWNDVISVTT